MPVFDPHLARELNADRPPIEVRAAQGSAPAGISALSGTQGSCDLISGEASPSFIAARNPRMPSPSPLPNSGIFFGPNTSNAIPRITIRCIGCNRPSNIYFLSYGNDSRHAELPASREPVFIFKVLAESVAKLLARSK